MSMFPNVQHNVKGSAEVKTGISLGLFVKGYHKKVMVSSWFSKECAFLKPYCTAKAGYVCPYELVYLCRWHAPGSCKLLSSRRPVNSLMVCKCCPSSKLVLPEYLTNLFGYSLWRLKIAVIVDANTLERSLHPVWDPVWSRVFVWLDGQEQLLNTFSEENNVLHFVVCWA